MLLTPFKFAPTRGATLLEGLIAVAILGAAVMFTSVSIGVNLSALRQSQFKSDMVQMRARALANVSCSKTLASGCDGPISLKTAKGTTFLPSSGKREGKWWTYRAFCDKSTREVTLRAALLKTGKAVDSTDDASFALSPLANKPVKWDSPEGAVIPAGFGFCQFSEVGDGSVPLIVPPTKPPSPVKECESGYQISSRTVLCAAGEMAIAGGHGCDSPGSGDPEVIYSNFTPGHTGWEATCCHNNGTPVVNVRVMCIKLP